MYSSSARSSASEERTMKRKLLIPAAALSAWLLMVMPVQAATFQVVVNAGNPARTISKTALQDYFLGKATRWPDGTTVVALDQRESSAVRADFSKAILGKTVANVKSYWLTIVFAGRGVPP